MIGVAKIYHQRVIVRNTKMAMKARYTVINGEVVAEKRNGVRRLYTPDPLGSTIALIDNTQTITDTFQYWPYGEESGRTGTTAIPLRHGGVKGYFQDSALRSYVRARVLDQARAHWLTSDPIGFASREVNLFIYARGNPVTALDPSGLQFHFPPLPSRPTKCFQN